MSQAISIAKRLQTILLLLLEHNLQNCLENAGILHKAGIPISIEISPSARAMVA
jgi:hypothetical protein